MRFGSKVTIPFTAFAAVVILIASVAAQHETYKVRAGDALPGAAFGRAVAMDGDVAMIGARNHGSTGPFFYDGAGATYVYRHTGTAWVEAHELTASDAASGDWFGCSVALDGDVAVIGALGDSHNGSVSGSAYVFRFDGSAWVEEDKLVAANGERHDEFGTSVAVAGDLAVVGAPENSLTDHGRAYVFRFDDNGWVEEAELLASDGEAKDDFGISVAVSGDVVVVGAWNEGNTGQTFPDGTGAAYVFRHDPATGAWPEEAKLVATAPQPGERDRFGHSVSLSGTALVVGTWPISAAEPAPSGSAYVFRHDGSGWIDEAKLVASDAAPGDAFGHAVSISGNLAVIGAWGEWSPPVPCSQDPPFPGVCNAGSAYVFRGGGGNGWIEAAKLNPSDVAEGDAFAWAVGASHDAAVIGAWRDGDGGLDSGSAYVFHGLGDCNGNGVLDIHDVAEGTSQDLNGNGIPDECECSAESYCDRSPNSAGAGAGIGFQGSLSIADGDFRLSATGCPTNKFGLFFYGTEQIQLPFGNGLRCVGGKISRLPVVNTGATGSASYVVTFASPPTSRITPFTTWNFQFWFRDPPGGGSRFNTSDGLAAIFCP